MNRVLDVNGRDCTCLLEPGVSYFALYDYLQKNGFTNLWIDNPDLGKCSRGCECSVINHYRIQVVVPSLGMH